MQKHQLIIMRHAKSDWSEENKPDFDRRLTSCGRKAAKRMGKWLKHNQYRIDRIVCSPALRAKQTCQLVAVELSILQHNIHLETGAYDASLDNPIFIINHIAKIRLRFSSLAIILVSINYPKIRHLPTAPVSY